MQQEITLFLICTAITTVLGIIAYFLKRTMTRGDKNEHDIQCLKDSCVKKDDFKELKDDLSKLSEKYATKEEVREIKSGMEKIRTDIEFVKDKSVRNEDFIRVMTRLENKIDLFNDRR